MTSTNLSRKQLNFAQISIVCVDILKQCLIDILHIHIKPTDLGKEISLSPSLTAGKDKLNSEQRGLCCPSSPCVPDYSKFDVTLLYRLIRNLCPKLKPSKEWGKEPKSTDLTIGDDIERIRLFRNKHYAHADSAEIPDSEFTDLWDEGKSLIHRLQKFTTTNGYKTDYGLNLANISGRIIRYKEYTSYVDLFRAISIERNVEVTCGDTAHFKADIRLEESAFLSVSWEKVDGSARKHIDINCEKYKGSTSRQLNIHSVCKEDAGEYQAVISRNIDHKIFSNIGFLQTQGELPRLDNLKVSTAKEKICIHYSHTVLENSPRINDIEWTKNKTPLDLTNHKYCGGGLEDSCLTICCPTKEDRGEYSCTVSNAVGSVSRVVILDEPSAEISTKTTVVHGSETRFSCLILSCPSPEEIEWQKSCDGNTFYRIDINELKYHRSNEDPISPVLCLPKTTFDDQQFYRIFVRNKIGVCMSNTHFLEVIGNRPNITNATCTTIDRSVRLNCDVFLYDKSPALQEVYWTKNEHRLDVQGSGGKYSVGVSPTDPSLTINNVNEHDAGDYQLTAINSVGPTKSDVIALGVPHVVSERNSKNEDGSQCFMVTIKSNPAPFFVQWNMKDKKSETLQQIPVNVNADEYKGTSNSFPSPMLVVKHNESLENYSFRLKMENVIGFTEKVIPDETNPIVLKLDDNKINIGNLNRIYERRGSNIRFGKVFDELAEKFPESKISRLKDLIQNSCEVEDVTSLNQAKSARDCFRILRSENIFTPEDVICLQYLLKMTECEELERKCIEYAKIQNALYYYEKPPDNGYKNVHFHIVANIRGYSTENITKIRETVAAIVGCTIEEVRESGYLHSASFILVLSIKNNLVNKLLALKGKDRDKISKLGIDYFKIDSTTIRLEFSRGS